MILIEDMNSVKQELEVKLAKIGFAPSEQTFNKIRVDRKTKAGKALNRIFNEYTDVHFNEQTISVYSKRNIFMRLQMHLNQLK